MIRRYVAAFNANDAAGAALVHMATGTGKTGVIAAVARCLPEIRTVLILAPRLAIRGHLLNDVKSRFFDRLKHRPTRLPKTVADLRHELAPRHKPNQRWSLADKVLITTFQMLETMLRDATHPSKRTRLKRSLYRALQETVDVVLIDEAHYEPALSWSRALRTLGRPRVLFTATPYRNDLKPFDIDNRHATHFTFTQALARHVIRRVEPLERPHTNDPKVFINDVLEVYDATIQPRWPGARVIIRCDSAATIEQMTRLLEDRGRSCVAIHERFGGLPRHSSKRRTVPSRDVKRDKSYYEDQGPTFWIHQYKLLEGIDDDRFRLVALFERLGNQRQVVQQIGRVIRNPHSPRPDTAFLLDHSNGYHKRSWDALVAYDDTLRATASSKTTALPGEISAPDERRTFVQKVLDAHDAPTYFRGEVRERFSFKAFNPLGDLRLPMAAHLLRRDEVLDFAAVREALSRRLQAEDCEFELYEAHGGRTLVVLYIAVESAPFLSTTYLLAGIPGVIVVRELKRFIAFYDSAGRSPLGLVKAAGPISSLELKRIFSSAEGSKLVEAAMKNSQLGHAAPRTRSLTAASIAQTTPGLDDHAQVLSRVSGYSLEAPRPGEPAESGMLYSRRRYLGFRRGKVVETGAPKDLADYIAWLDELESVTADASRGLPDFGRYAKKLDSVTDATPKNVLLDVFEVVDDFETVGSKAVSGGETLRLEDVCQDVGRQRDRAGHDEYSFVVNGNSHLCRVFIRYDPKRARYALESPDLDALYRRKSGTSSLVAYLNDEQSFRVIPASRGAVYVDGEFYEPIVSVGAAFDADSYHVGKILETHATLNTLTDEKGRECEPGGGDWDRDSLFGAISRLGRGYGRLGSTFGRPEILVCDDLEAEMADFILADGERVVFIHAKGLSGKARRRLYSASELSVVCSQAVKNLGYLSMFNTQPPKDLSKWLRPWSVPHTAGAVTHRIRISDCGRNPDLLWNGLQSRISNPRTRREVWLVLGGILSKKALERELGRTRTTPEAIQAVTLLHSTLAAVGSVDAKLRILCGD